MTHIPDEQLVSLALGDLDEAGASAAESHVEHCAACREALREILAVLEETATLPVPGRGDTYGAQVWAALEPKLPAPQQGRAGGGGRSAWGRQSWLAAAAALVIAVGGFLAGRVSRVEEDAATPPPTAERLEPEAIRERVVLAAVGEHLDRTERTLVELVNNDVDGRVDISAEQAWARDLLEANRLYRQAASGRPALSQVLEDLEPVLIEIANSPSRLTADEFHALRDRIETRSLLFKVRVTGAELRDRQRTFIRGEKQS
jgi:hypothetical protein